MQGLTHSFSRLGNALTPPLTAVWVLVYAWYFRNDPRKHPHIRAEEVAGLPPETRAFAETTREPTPWSRLVKRIAPTMMVCFC